MQKEKGRFSYLDVPPALYAFFAWVLLVFLVGLGDIRFFNSAAIVCLPFSCAIYFALIAQRLKKQNNLISHSVSVTGGLFVFCLLFSADYVSHTIFGITHLDLKIEFKIFVSGWGALGMSFGELYTYKSMLKDERE